MKLLLVTYDYEPVISPRAFRWSAITKHWAKKGYNIDVICACKPGLAKMETSGNIRVYRVGPSVIQILQNRLSCLYDNPGMFSGKSDNSNNSSFFMRLRPLIKWIYDYTWKKVYWPDFACLWYLPATRKARQLLANQCYDALVSVSHPFTGHLIGLALKKRYPGMKWLVDIGDPFCFLGRISPNNHNFFRKLNYSAEKKVFNLADKITVTTEGTLAKYSKIFPDSTKKINVIPPLALLPAIPEQTYNVLPEDNKIKFVFIGTLYKSIRNPDFLLKLFASLLQTQPEENLELHFWGNISECWGCFNKYQRLLNHKIFIHGVVDRNTVSQVMEEATLLINIGNDTPYQLPSKVVEYVNTKKPILNIVKTLKDSSVVFFKSYPATLNIVEEDGLSSEQIEKVLKFIECPPKVESSTLKSWLASFNIDSIARSYEELLTCT